MYGQKIERILFDRTTQHICFPWLFHQEVQRMACVKKFTEGKLSEKDRDRTVLLSMIDELAISDIG
jgi:hypothetical protein